MKHLTCLACLLLCAWVSAAEPAARPNILWLTCEDTGPELGCLGNTYTTTPHLDALAQRGMAYRKVWSCAPVCAPARTTIITGVYPTGTGGEHMRSLSPVPGFLKFYPQLLRAAGYYCANNNKEDYNLKPNGPVWDDSSLRAHYKNRGAGQPFFAIFNNTGTHESQIRKRPYVPKHDPAKVRVPAYHPDHPEVRLDWAQYYDRITEMDARCGEHLRELEAAGLVDETIVFFYGDHGSGMPRSKRWPYNSGLGVGLIVYVPPKYRALAGPDYQPGTVSGRLVSFADLAPTVLSLAGVKPPEWMDGRAFLGPFMASPHEYLHGFRGRMDERADLVRSVTDGRFVYIRNYMPHKIYGQYIDFMFQTPTTRIWRQLYDEGKLKPPQTFFWEPKPPEELYDLQADPDEVNNLASSADRQPVLERFRQVQRAWALQVRDVGLLPEGEIHSRSQGSTPYEMGHDPARFPLEKILAAAELASGLKPEALPELRRLLAHSDSAVRYWAALGCQMRGAAGVDGALAELRAALKDTSPHVRIVAAQALAQHGPEADLNPALEVLAKTASAKANGVYVSLQALAAIDDLGPKARRLWPALKDVPLRDPQGPARAGGYASRLVERISARQ